MLEGTLLVSLEIYGMEFSWASFRELYFASSLSLSEISMKTFV